MKDKEYEKAIWAVCRKCGKRFLRYSSGAAFCGDPCVSDAELKRVEGPVPANEMTRLDCRSIVEMGGGYVCRGLTKLYCNIENCKFYKKRE